MAVVSVPQLMPSLAWLMLVIFLMAICGFLRLAV